MLEPSVLALDIYHSSWRNSLPFTSLRSVTIGSGRDFLEGQSQGLLEPADTHPAAAVVIDHTAEEIGEAQAVRVVVVPWVSS